VWAASRLHSSCDSGAVMKIADACGKTDAYSGEGYPSCFDGNGCVECIKKYHAWIDEHRQPMSPDLKAFYDYISMYKRVLQAGRLGPEDVPATGLYDVLAYLENSLRTGKYLHHTYSLSHILAEMNEGGRGRR